MKWKSISCYKCSALRPSKDKGSATWDLQRAKNTMSFNIFLSALGIVFPTIPFSFSTLVNPTALCCSYSCCTKSGEEKSLEINEPHFSSFTFFRFPPFYIYLIIMTQGDACIIMHLPAKNFNWKLLAPSTVMRANHLCCENEKLLNFRSSLL